MKRLVLAVAIGSAVAMTAGQALAINCDQVRRYLATGRTAEDIAESMIVDVSEVKKCEAAPAAKEGAPTPAAAAPATK